MPGGIWGQQARNQSQGFGGFSAPRPASPFDAANVLLRGGGQPDYHGRGDSSVQKRRFADVGKVNANLLDPLAQSRAATNYQPLPEDGGLLGLGNYYNAQQPGGLFAGLFGGIGQTVAGIFGEGAAKTGSDVGTFLGKTLEMPLAAVGSAGVPFIAPVIDAANAEIEKVTPYILRDTLKIPTNVGGAFQSMLNIFGLAGMAVERTYAGMDARGALPEDIEARLESGELKSRDEAFDELVLTSRGYSNDVMHNLGWNLLLDPANWVSMGVGAVGGAVRGTGTIARTFSAAVRAEPALAEAALAQGGRIAEVTQAALRREAITGMVDSRGLMNQMRSVMDDGNSRFRLSYVERLGMSALGPVSDDVGNAVAKVGNYILKATDPVNFFSGSKAGQRSMEFLTTAASTAAMAAYKPRVVMGLAKIADQIGADGEVVYRGVGINGGNALQEHVLSDLATQAMKDGAIPRTGALDATEAARELLRGGAYDSNIGKYIEVQIERNKDISVGMLPPEQMYNETVNKFASILGVDSARVRAAMKTVSSDEAIFVHALYYYTKGEVLHTGVLAALKSSRAVNKLASFIDPDRIAIVSSKTLTNVNVKELDAVIATGDVGAIRQAIEKYNDFNWVHNKNIPDSELVADVERYLEVNRPYLVEEVVLKDAMGQWLPDIPDELKAWAQDSETYGYKLGQKMPGNVPEDALWRVTRAPGNDGEILNANPYSEFWVEGGDSAKRLNTFTATKMMLTRSIRQERIIWSQRRRFITDMAKGSEDGGVDIPPALADRIFKALMYEAKDRFIQPRGMEPREMYTTAKRVLDDARKNNASYDNLATKLTERQVVLTLLRATQGEVALVGVTQKVTGGIKAFAPGSGANYWGRISERLYPLMRFTLNPVFQTMEATEPYILNSMRGIWTPLQRDSEKYQNALATRNAISQMVHHSDDPDGLAAETAEALATQAYTGSEAAAKFGRGKITRWMPHIGERKDVAAALETERIMGDHMVAAFKAIKGDEFEAFWADLEYSFGTTNRGQIAKRWMAANFALQDVNGFQVATIDDILKMKTLGKRMRLSKSGDKGAYTFSDVETVFDHVRSYDSSWTQGLRRERGLAPGEALIEDLKGMTREEWHAEVARSGLNTDNLTRLSQRTADDIWHMANGPEVDEFWNGQYTVNGTRYQGYRGAFLQGVTGQGATSGETAVWTRLARDQEIVHARALVTAAAATVGMTEEEFIKLHFEDIPRSLNDSTSITGGTLFEVRERWAEQALSHKWAEVRPVDAEGLRLAHERGEVHPQRHYIDSTDLDADTGFLLMKMQGSTIENIQDALATHSGFYPGDLPNRGYTSVPLLMRDVNYGDQVVRIPSMAVDGAGELEEGLGLIDKHSIIPTDIEVLTVDGWKPLKTARGGTIKPPEIIRTENLEVAHGQTIYSHDISLPENQAAGISKLDIEQIHQTLDERNAVDIYTGNAYKELNGFLRGTSVGPYPRYTDAERWDIIHNLDRAVAKGQTRERTTLYRGLPLTNAKLGRSTHTIDYENLYPEGQGPAGSEHTFKDVGFFSSSRDEHTARGFAGEEDEWSGEAHTGVIMTIDAPAGTHLHVHEGFEGELLWGRGVSFRVTARHETWDEGYGRTIHLNIEPVSGPVKPGVNRLALGEMPVGLRNEGRFLQDATSHPEALRGQYHLPHNDTLSYDEADEMQEAMEAGIAKAEAAKPTERVTYGPFTYGPRTVEEGLAEITASGMDSDDIEIAARALADIRNRADHLMESEMWRGAGTFDIANHNNVRLLASLAAGIAAEGGTRYGLNKVLEVMEILWARGPAAITDPSADAVTKEIGTHLVRGIQYGIEDPILTNKGNDALDAILNNTTRRATGRFDATQPVLADDYAAEAAGFITPRAYDDHASQGLIQPVAPAVPVASRKPGLAEALDMAAERGPTVPQREFNDTVRDYLEDAGLQEPHTGRRSGAPEVYVGEPNGFKLVHHPRGLNRRQGTANVWLAFAFDETGRPVTAIRLEGLPGADQPNYIAGVTNTSQGSRASAATSEWVSTKGYASRLYDWLQDETDVNLYPLTARETTPEGAAFSQRWLEHRKGVEAGAAAKPKVVAPALMDSADIPTGELPVTGTRLSGSTGPMQVRDPATGKLYVDKRGANPLHVVEEHNADTVYEALGVPVAPHTLLEGADTVKRAEMIEGAETLREFASHAPDSELRPVVDQIQSHFALDALLANWDVVGLEGDNIIIKNGVAYRIDNGGALRYRAQGAPKGEHWGPVVTELQRMRTGGSQWTQDVFGELTDAQVRRQVLDLGDQMPAILEALPPSLRETVQRRYEDMLAQTEHITPTPKAGEAPGEAAMPPRPAELGEYEHEHIVDHYNRMAQHANEVGFNGRSDWTAAELASVAGRARQRLGRTGGAVDVWEFRRAETQIRLGIAPGPGLERYAPLFDILNQKRYRAERQKVLVAAMTQLHRALRDQLGMVIERGDPAGIGMFDGHNPSRLFAPHILGTGPGAVTAAEVMAFATGQADLRTWKLGPRVEEIDDIWGYTARASIYIPPTDLTPRMAEKVAEAIGEALPEALDVTVTRGPNNTWHLQIIDTTGELFPRLDTGHVDEDRLNDFLSGILAGQDIPDHPPIGPVVGYEARRTAWTAMKQNMEDAGYWPEEYEQALNTYKEQYAGTMREGDRGLQSSLLDGTDLTEAEQRLRETLDAASETYTLDEPMVVYRGVQNLEEDGWSSPGYTSVAPDPVAALGYSGEAKKVYRIMLPKGFKYGAPNSEGDRVEMLLSRNIKWKVIAKHEDVFLNAKAHPTLGGGNTVYDVVPDMGAGAIEDLKAADLQLAVEYGDYTHIDAPRHDATTAALAGEVEGDVDWGLFEQQIKTRAEARGTPLGPSTLRDIRAAYQSEIEHELHNVAPKQAERLKNGNPVHGRSLEDRRGGDILGITNPGAGASAVIRGFAGADALTGVHELVHVFSIVGIDPSLREVVSKAMDQYRVANDAAKQAKLAVLQQKLASATNPGWRSRYHSDIVALKHDLQTPHPTEWGPEQEEFFVHAVMDWIDRGVPANPELANAFNHFRNWITVTRKELSKPGMAPLQTSPEMDALLNRMFSRRGVDTVSYSVEQQVDRMAGQQVLRGAWDEAHATHFYKRDRSMAERSINHPYIGLYPASYMWGKILPEMLRFLALRPFGMETPFLAWNVAREISDSVRAQGELDPGFKEWLEGNKDAFMLFSMMFPGLPHDIPANASLPVRRIAEQGLEAQAQYASGMDPAAVKDIDFGKGSMDAIQYALGPLGTIRTSQEVIGMSGNLVRTVLGETIAKPAEPSEHLPYR